MKKGAKRNQIISELLHVTDEEFTDEELIHQLIATEVTKNADKDEHMTFGQRATASAARCPNVMCSSLSAFFVTSVAIS